MIIRVFIISSLIYGSIFGDLYKRGKRVANILCDKKKLKEIKVSKEALLDSGVCKDMSSKNLKALMIYLKAKNKTASKENINIPKDAKCPVCGMFVAKYPKWISMIVLKNGKILYFDGVKDLMKFYLDPKRFKAKKLPVKRVIVKDYYSLNQIDAKDAYFVLGSNVYGPMGEELIAFKDLKDAKEFKIDHEGKVIKRFFEIEQKDLY